MAIDQGATLPLTSEQCQAVAIAQKTLKLVIFPVGGGIVHMRCERHAPEHVQEWLHFDDPPGFLVIKEVMEEEAKQRCVACLAESLG